MCLFRLSTFAPGSRQVHVCHFEVYFFSGYIEHGGEDWVSSGREDNRPSGQRGKLSDTSKWDNYIKRAR